MMEWKKIWNHPRMLLIFWLLFFIEIVTFAYLSKESRDLVTQKRKLLQEYHIEKDTQNSQQILTQMQEVWTDEFLEKQDVEQARLIWDLLEQVTYQSNYKSRIQDIIHKSDSLNKISIFSKDNSSGNYNLEKTREDYQKAAQIQPQFILEDGIAFYLEHSSTHAIVVLVGIVVVFFLMEENKIGLRSMLFSYVGGRGKLFLEKLVVLFLSASMICVVFYGGTLLWESILYKENGMTLWKIPVQSVSSLKDFLLPVNIGQFFGIYLLYRILLLFAIMLFCWVVMLYWNQVILSVGFIGILGIASYFLQQMIGKNHPLRLLRYCNVWYLQAGNDFFTEYANIPVFSWMINKNRISIFRWLLSVLLLFSFGLYISICKYPNRKVSLENIKWLYKLTYAIETKWSRLYSGFSLFQMELYKTFIVQKGVLVVGCICVFLCMQTNSTQVQHSETQELYYNFMKEYGGPSTRETEQYIRNLYEECWSIEKQYKEAELAYEQGELDIDQYMNILARYDASRPKFHFFEQLKEQRAYLQQQKKDNRWYVNWISYEHIFAQDNEINNICILFGIVLMCSGLYSYEKKSGMYTLLQGAPEGRQRLFSCKRKVVITVGTLLCVIYTGITLYNSWKVYGMEGLWTPVQCLNGFDFIPFPCSIFDFLVILFLIRWFFFTGLAQLVCYVSQYLEQRLTMGILLLLCIPSILSIAGIQYFSYFSIVRLLSITEIVAESHNILVMGMLAIGAVGLCILFERKNYEKWCREGK